MSRVTIAPFNYVSVGNPNKKHSQLFSCSAAVNKRKSVMKKVHILLLGCGLAAFGMSNAQNLDDKDVRTRGAESRDAIVAAQSARETAVTRPEQKKNERDRSGAFAAQNSKSSSTVFGSQPDHGRILGFDFYRDPLNAKKPLQSFEEMM